MKRRWRKKETRKRRKKRRKRKKTRTKQKREPPPPLATPLKFRFMVADKLRSLRLSFAFIENRMTLTTLTTCQILAALVLLPLDFPHLYLFGAEGGRPRHHEKFGLCLSPCPNTHTCPLPPPFGVLLGFLRSETWPLRSSLSPSCHTPTSLPLWYLF